MTTDIARDGKALTAALRALVEDYPTNDLDMSPVAHLTLTYRGAVLGHVHLQEGHVTWLAGLIANESESTRNSHHDQSGLCGHCQGTGSARLASHDGESR
jgi:hypothetical protein